MSLDGSRCRACGRLEVPARAACPVCASDMASEQVPPNGTVLAATRYPGDPWLALVELEGDARVVARATPEQALCPGDPVVLEDEDPLPRISPALAGADGA